jgi:hypothetical protein
VVDLFEATIEKIGTPKSVTKRPAEDRAGSMAKKARLETQRNGWISAGTSCVQQQPFLVGGMAAAAPEVTATAERRSDAAEVSDAAEAVDSSATAGRTTT